jgi:CarD family transcriptional regulator
MGSAMATAKKQDIVFNEGDFVVYPTHGVGKVTGVETEEISGAKLELIVIKFDKDRMTLRVPVSKAKNSGLRKLSTKQVMDDARATLRGKARAKKAMWSRRAQEYEAKINSGDPVSIAEVVRDLYRADDTDQSYSERQMYQAAMERLAREFAAMDGVDETTATSNLENVLGGRDKAEADGDAGEAGDAAEPDTAAAAQDVVVEDRQDAE